MFTCRNVIHCDQTTGKQCADTESGPCYLSAQAGNSSVHNWNQMKYLKCKRKSKTQSILQHSVLLPSFTSRLPNLSLGLLLILMMCALPRFSFWFGIGPGTWGLLILFAPSLTLFVCVICGNANICTKYCRPLRSFPICCQLFLCVKICCLFFSPL